MCAVAYFSSHLFPKLVLEHYEEFLGDCWKVGLSVGASRGLYELYELGKAILKGAAKIPSGENMLLRIKSWRWFLAL